MDEHLVRAAYALGQHTWPKLGLSFDHFSSHCQQVVDPSSGSDVNRFAGDLFLCAACALSDPNAVETLEHHAFTHMTRAIARINTDSDFVDETVQVLRHRLLVGPRPKIAEYSARGPLLAWLAVVATRAALDELRARQGRAVKRAELSEQLAAEVALDPEVSLAKLRWAPLFQEALGNALKELSARERNILRMRLLGNCSIDQIGRAYQVHRATADRWLGRARQHVFESIRRQLTGDMSALSEREFSSIANLVQSQLDISLSSQFSREGSELRIPELFSEAVALPESSSGD